MASHLCYALLGDRVLAEEACQKVFLRAGRGLEGFRGDAKLSTWLYTIARRVCLNLRERLTPPPERAGIDIMVHVRRLPPDHRAAVILFYLEERPYEEAAAVLGVPLGTFKTWLHRGKRELAARLGIGEVKR